MKVLFSEKAASDLLSIARYVRRDNPSRARSFVAELRVACDELGFMPSSYALMVGRESFGIRRRPYGNYLIFYKVENASVSVLRILNAARDHDALLFPDA